MDGVERVEQKDDTHLHWVAKIGGDKRGGMRRSPSNILTTASPGKPSINLARTV